MNGGHTVYLYGEPAVGELDVNQLTSYVATLLPGLRVEARPPFVSYHLASVVPGQRAVALDGLARAFAQAKVTNPLQSGRDVPPLAGEVGYERKRLESPGGGAFGLLYDGVAVMNVLASLMPSQERGLDSIHVVFTKQLLGTWEESDCRYHARVAIFGYPSLLSTSGVVEAPARPREYYILKQRYQALGLQDAAVLKLSHDFRGRFLEHGDARMTEIMKGYVAQALFYHLSGDPFCANMDCRLFNAHWQEEVLHAQVKPGNHFCAFHEGLLRSFPGADTQGQTGSARLPG